MALRLLTPCSGLGQALRTAAAPAGGDRPPFTEVGKRVPVDQVPKLSGGAQQRGPITRELVRYGGEGQGHHQAERSRDAAGERDGLISQRLRLFRTADQPAGVRGPGPRLHVRPWAEGHRLGAAGMLPGQPEVVNRPPRTGPAERPSRR